MPQSFSDLLGPSRNRYLSDGFRHVSHTVRDLHLDCNGNTVGRAKVEYPEDWSKKGKEALAPHLSTIDGIVLSSEAAEHSLKYETGLTDDDIRTYWIKSITLRSGKAPYTGLDNIGIQGASESGPKGLCFTCTVGNFQVALQIGIPAAALSTSPHQESHPISVRDSLSSKPYGGLYKRVRYASEVTNMQPDQGFITTTHSPTDFPDDSALGIEGYYMPSATLIDLMRLSAQAAQILIYAVDGVERAETGNLWMQSATFKASRPKRNPDKPADCCARIVQDRTYRKQGKTARKFKVTFTGFYGMDASATLIYFRSSHLLS